MDKFDNREDWENMAFYLKFLERLMGTLMIDPRYNSLMTKKTWGDRLSQAIDSVSGVRDQAEERMGKYSNFNLDFQDIFYGHDNDAEIEELVNLVLKMKKNQGYTAIGICNSAVAQGDSSSATNTK